MEIVLLEQLKRQQDNLSTYQNNFKSQDEFIYIKNFFTKEFVEKYLSSNFETLKPLINRAYVPLTKKGKDSMSFRNEYSEITCKL